MNRVSGTLLPTKLSLLKPIANQNVKEKINKHQKQYKTVYDRNSKEIETFAKGEHVWLLQDGTWVAARVLDKDETPRSYWVRTGDGSTYRRNSWWLRSAERGHEKPVSRLKNKIVIQEERNVRILRNKKKIYLD